MTAPVRLDYHGEFPEKVRDVLRSAFDSRQLPAWLRSVGVFTFDEPDKGHCASISPRPEYQTAVLSLNVQCFADLVALGRDIHHEIDHLFQGHALRMVAKLTDALPDPTNRTLWEAFLIAVEHDRCEIETLRPPTPASPPISQ